MTGSDRLVDSPRRAAAGLTWRSPLEPLARAGAWAWRLLTDVRFAVILITLLVLAGLVGTLVRQFRVTASDEPARYAAELAEMHRAWDGIAPLGLPVGSTLVDAFDRVGLFTVFSTPWFLLLMTVLTVSIVACTLDRTPRLWRGVREVRVEQPEPFFDPRLEQRAALHVRRGPVAGGSAAGGWAAGGSAGVGPDVVEPVADAFRARGLRARRSVSPDGSVVWLYGDRNQYNRMATLLTHAGLVLFLAAGAVTVALGFETVVFVGEGQTAPVQRVGTPGNLLVKVFDFQAPQRADGSFADFATDLAVYRDGEEVARKTIRVNDPLAVAGFVFHQNTFGPSAELAIRDPAGRLVWDGPLVLAGDLLGRPQGFMTIPGADVGLLALLDRDAEGRAGLVLQGVGASAETGGEPQTIFLATLPVGATSDPAITADHAITWQAAGAWSGMVIKNDPGQPIVWVAFGLLITGLVLTFYFPRRRAWARVEGDRVALAFIADRYVDKDREFGELREAVARAVSASAVK
ncbi:cytochrome c biogenesis protein ResB [soil metagenome]